MKLIIPLIILALLIPILSAETCEDDCTYTSDQLCHKECQGQGLCIFQPGADTICDQRKSTFIVDYDITNKIQCCQGSPFIETPIKVTSIESDQLLQIQKLSKFQGKPVKIIINIVG